MLHSRMKRVEAQYRDVLATILEKDMDDPRLHWVSVTGVRVGRDLSNATVHVSVLGDDPQKETDALDALNAAKGFIKRQLSEKMRLKRLPDPHFRIDSSSREAFRLFHIMEGLRTEDAESTPANEAELPDAAEFANAPELANALELADVPESANAAELANAPESADAAELADATDSPVTETNPEEEQP